ncbi:MAG: RHS repeat-associated core domain-containing protein [Bacillota bacterium]|nr:RHS repeat-associated core domain-containing protein [Bacillota bacterium]
MNRIRINFKNKKICKISVAFLLAIFTTTLVAFLSPQNAYSSNYYLEENHHVTKYDKNFEEKIEYTNGNYSGILTKDGDPIATVTGGSYTPGDESYITYDVDTGTSVPPSKWQYNKDGYTGDLNLVNYENNPTEKDLGHYDPNDTQYFTRRDPSHINIVKNHFYNLADCNSNNNSFLNESKPVPNSYPIDDNGYKGNIPLIDGDKISDVVYQDEDGYYIRCREYVPIYGGDVEKWITDIQTVADYTGHYSGKVTKADNDTRVWQYTQNYIGNMYSKEIIDQNLGTGVMDGDPVNVVTGNFHYKNTDLSISERGLPLEIVRYFNTLDDRNGVMGMNWRFNYESNLEIDASTGNIRACYPDGHSVVYRPVSGSDEYKSPEPILDRLTKNTDNTYTLKLQSKDTYIYNTNGQLTSMADKNGNVTILQYSGNLLNRVNGADGKALNFDYENGYLKTITDPMGRTIVFTYDSNQRLTQVKGIGGGTTVYEYYSNGLIKAVTDQNSRKYIENEYDEFNRVVKQYDENRNLTEFSYDEVNMENTETVASTGKVIKFKYNTNLYVTKKTFDDGTYEEYTYDKWGNKDSIRDRNGNVTSYTFDSHGNMLTVKTPDPFGYTTVMTYDNNDNLTSIVTPGGSETTIMYDNNSNLTKVSTKIDASTTASTNYSYDSYGRVTSVADAENNTTSYEYGINGSPVKITDPGNNTINYTYDDLNRVSSMTTAYGTTSYQYDLNDKVAKVIDPAGNTTRMKYDNNGNLTKLIKPMQYNTGTDDGTGYTYQYDAMDRLIKQIDPLNNISAVQYNTLGEKTKEINPNYYNAGTDDGTGTGYEYDGSGRIIKIDNPSGKKARIKYDPVGNKIKTIDANNYNETIDDGPGIEYSYDEMNRLVEEKDTDGNVIKRLVYDQDSRIVKEIDAKGYLNGQDDASRYGTEYKYNLAGWLTEIRKPVKQENGTVYYQVKKYTYDLTGKVLQEKTSPEYVSLTNEPSVWNSINSTYYKNGKLKTVSDSAGGYIEYTYDAVGNLISEKQKINDSKFSVTGYHYNNLGKMDKSWQEIDSEDLKDGGSGKVNAETLYEYDKNGNITKITRPEGYVTTLQYDDADRLTAKNETVPLEQLNLKKTGISITSNKTAAYPGQQFECSIGIQPDSTVTGVDIQIDYDERIYQFMGFNPGDSNVFVDGGTPGKIHIRASGTSYQNTTTLASIKFKVQDGIAGIGYISIDPVSVYTDSQGKEYKYFESAGKAISVGIPDLNNDMKVGADDFTLDALQKGVFAGSPEYNEKFDINGDGVIDVSDLDYIKDYLFDNVKINALVPGKFLDKYISNSYDITSSTGIRTTTYEYDKVGNIVKETDCNGNSINYTYDAYNRLISVTDKSGAKSRVFYDETGNIIKEIMPENYNSSSDNGAGTTYVYDAMNRLSKVIDEEGNVTQNNIYDVSGELIKTIDAKGYLSGSDNSSRYGTEYTYDIGGRLTSVCTPESKTKGKLSQSYTYDAIGNVLTYTDGEGSTTNYQRNMWGKILKVTDPYSISTTYNYDYAGNLTSVKDGKSNTTQYNYNSLNKLASLTDALGQTITYKYDKEGRVASEVDRNGQTIQFDYNSDNNLTGRSIAGKNESERYIYGLDGLLKTAVNPTSIIDYDYTANGQIKDKSVNGEAVLSYDYNGNGDVINVADKTGTDTSYTYDVKNRLKTVSNGNKGLATYNYNADNTIASVNYNNGVNVSYGYDKNLNVTSLVNRDPQGKAIGDYAYTYDNSGNQLTKTENGVKTTYTYDKMNRLLSAGNQSYTYDNAGNMATKTIGSDVTSYSYDANNRLTRSTDNGIITTYNYDKNGNQVNKSTNGQTTNYTYDGYNRLIEVDNPDSTWQTNIYDAEGMRSGTVENGLRTDYVFDRGNVVTETSENNNATTRYIRGIDLIAQDNGTGSSDYYLHNAHGDVTNVVDNNGSILNSYSYDAFGNTVSSSEKTANRFMYSGEQFDKIAGQYYLRARNYDPATGRFVTEDSYKGTLNSILSLNLYTYCLNNPILFLDPSGHEQIVISGGKYSEKKSDYPYNFIETAIKRLRELKKANSSESITWIIAMTGYSDSDRKRFIEDANDIGINIRFIHSNGDLLDYINIKDGGNRQEDKITEFDVFAHGYVGSIELGLHQPDEKNLSFSINDIKNIDKNAFNNPNAKFYTCNTGTSVNGGNSFAQEWVNKVGGKALAFIGKTSYDNINKGESIWSKINRYLYGFSWYGSKNYPSAGLNAYSQTFVPQN